VGTWRRSTVLLFREKLALQDGYGKAAKYRR